MATFRIRIFMRYVCDHLDELFVCATHCRISTIPCLQFISEKGICTCSWNVLIKNYVMGRIPFLYKRLKYELEQVEVCCDINT